MLTRLVVPQAVKGNRNRAKAGVATRGRHSLSFPRARRTESRSRGGEVTLRATATAKWPSRLQREVTATAEAAQGRLLQRPAARDPKSFVMFTAPPRGGTGGQDWVPVQLPTPGSGSLTGASLCHLGVSCSLFSGLRTEGPAPTAKGCLHWETSAGCGTWRPCGPPWPGRAIPGSPRWRLHLDLASRWHSYYF